MLSRDDRDGAISAVTVTPLTDLDVGIMVGSREVALAVARMIVHLAQISNELFVVELAIIFVHLRNFLLEFLTVAL